MNQPPQIDVILQEGEGYLVEFKESPVHLERDICAFANASGGTIYIGLSDRGNIKPQTLTNRLKAQLHQAAQACDPPPHIDVEQLGPLIVLKIHESSNKPVRASNGFYLRVGATSQKLTRDHILSFAVKEAKILFDQQLFLDAPATELLNTRHIEWFRQRAQLDHDIDNLALLRNLGCLQTQRGTTYLTYAGILCFAENPQAIFPHATLTVLHMASEEKIREQRILRGTLFEQVEKGFAFLQDHLVTTPQITGLARDERPEFPPYVVRELLVNALVHRDYFERSADVMVKIFPEQLEFANPGCVSSHMPMTQIFGKSYRRNPLIADLFYRARYIERAGTGLLRVKRALEEQHLPPMTLLEEGPFFICRLVRPSSLPTGLTERQQQLLALPDTFFPFSTITYAQHFGVSERAARLDIHDLIKKKILAMQRRGQQIRYKKK